MRSFDLVDYKVGEAEYFLKKMFVCWDPIEIRFLFSAYASAMRSITFCLQATLSDVQGFKNWYQLHQIELKKNHLAKFFLNARNTSQKVGVIPIYSGTLIDGKILFYFGHDDEIKNVPQEDVITASMNYFKLILKIVYDCYNDFGTIIDPYQYYTKANFNKMGKTIDDLDEEFFGIRGYTYIEGWPETYRWEIIRNQIPGCKISSFFVEYLDLLKPQPPILPKEPKNYDGRE